MEGDELLKSEDLSKRQRKKISGEIRHIFDKREFENAKKNLGCELKVLFDKIFRR